MARAWSSLAFCLPTASTPRVPAAITTLVGVKVSPASAGVPGLSPE